MARVRGVVVILAVVLAASVGAFPVSAKEATPSDFWSAAADAATATVYAPSRKVLTRLGRQLKKFAPWSVLLVASRSDSSAM